MNNCSLLLLLLLLFWGWGGVGSTVLSFFAATIMNVGSRCVEFILYFLPIGLQGFIEALEFSLPPRKSPEKR